MARLLLADDHRLFRQGLRELLERKTDHVVVGEAATGMETLALAAELAPDVVLLDIQMPELDGVAVARRLAADHPPIRVIMLTMHRHDRLLLDAILAGARGYVLKDADARELIDAIARVERGEAMLDPAMTLPLLETVRRLSGREPDALTERELDLIRLVAAGHDNRAIADRLFLSEKTVGNRLSDVFRKLGVANRTQAAIVAVQRGLIPSAAPDGDWPTTR